VKKRVLKKLAGLFALLALLNVSACGYFLYPERVGQKSGKIDPAIVVLDAAGLLFGLLPGVVAFAVDLTTGTIYLSPGQKSVIEKHDKHLVLQDRGMIDSLRLKPAGENEVTIDQIQTANELSILLDEPIKAEQIEYYKSFDRQSTFVAVKALSGMVL